MMRRVKRREDKMRWDGEGEEEEEEKEEEEEEEEAEEEKRQEERQSEKYSWRKQRRLKHSRRALKRGGSRLSNVGGMHDSG